MATKQWTIVCPHCKGSFVQNEAQLSAGHLQGALGAFAAPDAAAKILEDYTITCPACAKPIPFEPRSHYRQQKVAALEKALKELKLSKQADLVGRQMVTHAEWACEKLLGMLRTDCPLEDVRTEAGMIGLVMKSLPYGKEHPARTVIKEVCAVAGSDIGGRGDLPEAPVDEVELKRQVLQRAIGILAEAKAAEAAPAKAAPAKAAPARQAPAKRRSLALPLIILGVLLLVAWKIGLFDTLLESLSGSQ